MIWESSDAHGDFYPIPQEHENSTTYTDLQLFSLHDGCYHEAVSVLTMQLTVNDSGNSMRCYIQNSYVNHSSVQTAAVYSIGLVKNCESVALKLQRLTCRVDILYRSSQDWSNWLCG